MAKSTGNMAGQALAEVLPQNDKAWYRVPYLLNLNLLLMIPLMSSAVAGFDGRFPPLPLLFHYDIAYTPLVFAYPTEILQYSIRSKGLSVELGIVYGSLVILSFVKPIALDALGWRWYILCCCITAVSVVANWILLPETKGRSLEELSMSKLGTGVEHCADVRSDEKVGL